MCQMEGQRYGFAPPRFCQEGPSWPPEFTAPACPCHRTEACMNKIQWISVIVHRYMHKFSTIHNTPNLLTILGNSGIVETGHLGMYFNALSNGFLTDPVDSGILFQKTLVFATSVNVYAKHTMLYSSFLFGVFLRQLLALPCVSITT